MRVDSAVYFGHDNKLLARKIELLDGVSKHFLRQSIGVDIGSVERLDAMVVRELDVLRACLLVEDPFLPVWVAVLHASEDDLGYFEAGFPEPHYMQSFVGREKVSQVR